MSNAPVSDRMEILKQQEELAIFDSFSENDAFALGLALREIARKQMAPVVIDIRTSDRILFHVALPGASPDNDHWVRRKANTTLRNHQSSLRVGDILASKDRKMGPETGADPMDFASNGGSFPIRLRQAGVIAAVTVSGLPQLDDHRMVIAALAQHLDITLPRF